MSTKQLDVTASFAELGLSQQILSAIQEAGYETPSPIQAQTIQPLLAGRDLLGQAQTGTGKTAAFSLPLLSKLNSKQKTPQILVLTPTRELAIQVAEAMQAYGRYLKNFHVLPIYGGQSMGLQLRALQRQPQAIVGTPGRILDHLRRGKLQLDDLQALVLDEADEMLRMGFIDDVETILQETPQSHQIVLFSATMPKPIYRVARRYLNDPVEIHIKAKTSTVETTNQRYWQVTKLHKLDALTRILEVEDFDGMIIFVRTKNATTELAEKLEARGYAASALNGDMNQALREKTIEKVRTGKIDILIATDVAARGLDIDRVSHVINYDIPYDTESYVHRIGRTGRAGRKGEAILFVSPRERHMLSAIKKATRQTIDRMNLPSSEEISDRRVMAFKQILTETIESQDLDFFKNLMRQYQQQHNTDLLEMAAALAFLAQKTRPLVPVKHYSEQRETKPRQADQPHQKTEQGMVTYRVEVGAKHDVQPGHLVGAIANEAGLDSQYIGRINIMDDHSFINLPEGMPRDIFQHLRKVWVNQHQLHISFIEDDSKIDKPSDNKIRATRKPTKKRDLTLKNTSRKRKSRH